MKTTIALIPIMAGFFIPNLSIAAKPKCQATLVSSKEADCIIVDRALQKLDKIYWNELICGETKEFAEEFSIPSANPEFHFYFRRNQKSGNLYHPIEESKNCEWSVRKHTK